MIGSEQLTRTSTQSRPIVRCGSCGATYRRLQWTQGMVCPKCCSPDFFPVIIIDGALDYALADRTHGFAPEDIRFGQLAKWAGLITQSQYARALSLQQQLARRNHVPPHIAQIMISEGILKSTQASAIFQVMCKPRPAADDDLFAQMVLRNNLTGVGNIEECRRAQKQMAKGRHEVPPLGQLMFEKRYLNENQVQAVYRKMRGQGVVHEIARACEANRKLTPLEKLMGTKDEPERRRNSMLLCILTVIVFAVWAHWMFGPSGETMWFKCENPGCAKVFDGSFADKFPTKCPYCKQETAMYARKCCKCGTVFGTNGWWGRAVCPDCRSWNTEKYTGE